MTQQHPITPPQELRDKWLDEAPNTSVYDYLIDSAAQWGADQELEACCEWLKADPELVDEIRADRRPKPPSLKGQALAELAEWENVIDIAPDSPIRRALEQLDD